MSTISPLALANEYTCVCVTQTLPSLRTERSPTLHSCGKSYSLYYVFMNPLMTRGRYKVRLD